MSNPFANDRRQFLKEASGGFAMTAFAGMCGELRGQSADPLASRSPHSTPAADRVIFIYSTGGVSHVDTFDHKPQLSKDHGKSIVASRWLNKPGEFTRYLIKPRWNFKQYGESGTWVSDLFPHIGSVIDDICVLNAMHCDSDGHDKGTLCRPYRIRTIYTSQRRFLGQLWIRYGKPKPPFFHGISPRCSIRRCTDMG